MLAMMADMPYKFANRPWGVPHVQRDSEPSPVDPRRVRVECFDQVRPYFSLNDHEDGGWDGMGWESMAMDGNGLGSFCDGVES